MGRRPHSFPGDQRWNYSISFCYRGIWVPWDRVGSGWGKGAEFPAKELLQGLNNITRAPLKPHQRMVIFRKFLVPRFLHELVLAPVGDGWLRWLDTTLRANVHLWLKLPNDTPVAFFYAGVADGGLVVPSLRYSILVMRRKRLEAICLAMDPLSTALVASPFFKELDGLSSKTLDGRLVSDKQSLAKAWADCPYTKVDGRGLSEARSCPEASRWVSNPPRKQSGANYIGAIKARGGLLSSKVCSARGSVSGVDARCDCCMHPETTRHVIQVCPRTSNRKIQRHDRVVRFVSAVAELAGYKFMVEPRIVGRTLGVRKPDLVLWNESKAYVADVTITSDQVGGARAHRDKVAYYHQPEIREWVQNITGLTDVSFSAVAANWRGVLSALSADFLKSVLKLSSWEISLLGLWICEESCHIQTF